MADPSLTPDQILALAAAQAKYNAQIQKSKELTEDLVDEYDVIEKKLDDISKLINNQLKQQGASTRQISEIKSIYSSLSKTNKELQYFNEKFYEGTLKTKDISKQLAQLDITEMSIRRQIVLAEDQGNKILSAKFKKQLRILDLERAEALTLKSQNDLVDKRVGLTGKLLSGLEKIPILGEAVDFEEINTNMRLAAGNSNVFAAGLKTAGKQLKEGLKDPLVQFSLLTAFYGKILKSAYSWNELLTSTRRQLALNVEQSEELYNNQFKYASAQHNSFVTTKMMQEATVKLNETLGTSVYLGNENVEAFGRLTKYYNLSEQEAGKLVELSTIQGKNTKDILNSTLKTAVTTKSQIGGTISYQEVLKRVGNTSGDILTKFKGNTDALAAAVIQASKLGMTLEQIDQVGDSLLNFESSIENELKAELLTGKAINLEKARAAALSGDQVTLMKEISNQVGNIHDFEKLNVIQRKAYAEAFGMNVKDMSDMLRKKEFEAKLGDAASKSAKEQLEYAAKNGIKVEESVKQQLEAKSLADEQKETFEKLNEILGKIMKGPMSKFLHIIEKVLEKVNGIMESFGKFTGGTLGSALGTAILSAPLLIGATRLLSGGLRAMLIPKPSGRSFDPIATYDVGGSGGGGGGGGIADTIMNIASGGKGFAGKKALISRFGSAGAARTAIRGFRGGGIATAIGLGTELIASQMDEGESKDVVSGLGQTASYAGTGAMIGSVILPGIGTAVGAIVGGGIGLIKSFFDAEDNRKAREEANEKRQKEQEKRTTEILEQFATRPVQLNVGGKTILDFNTAQNLYGTSNNSLAN